MRTLMQSGIDEFYEVVCLTPDPPTDPDPDPDPDPGDEPK